MKSLLSDARTCIGRRASERLRIKKRERKRVKYESESTSHQASSINEKANMSRRFERKSSFDFTVPKTHGLV